MEDKKNESLIDEYLRLERELLSKYVVVVPAKDNEPEAKTEKP